MLTRFADCEVDIQNGPISTEDFLEMVSVDVLCDLFYNNLALMSAET